MHATDIVGYTFSADNYHPSCVIETLVQNQILSPAARDMIPEDALEQHAEANCINWQDEHTFDSGDFPKVIFADSVESDDEICGLCGDPLISS